MLIRSALGAADNRRIEAMLYANNGGAFQIPRAGLAVAFDAAIGITSSGGFASAWADQSGNARHLLQATGANQPIHLPFVGTKYGYLPGVAGNYFSTPDSVAASVTGDIDIRVKVALADWSPSASQELITKFLVTGNQRSYGLEVFAPNGQLSLAWSTNGTAVASAQSTANLSALAAGTIKWVRATLDVDNGAGGYTARFYTSDDAVTWVQLGADVVGGGVTSIFDSTATVEVGTYQGGTLSPLSGSVYAAQIYNGIGGTLAVDFDPSRWTSGSTFTAATGETWTINSTGSKPAQIVDRPSLLFDGVAHFMAAAFTLNQPETIYFVGKQVTWTINDYVFDGGSTNKGLLYLTGATPQLNIYAGTSVAANTDFTVGVNKVACVVFNGASSSLKVNTNAETTGNAGAANMGGFTLGANGDLTGGNCGNIQAHEVLIYATAHDAPTRAAVIRALMSKWGIT